MIDIKGIGSEGVILITAFLLFKDVFIPFWKKVLIPQWAKLTRKNPSNPGNPDSTRGLNSNTVTAKEVLVALKSHIKADDDRTKIIQGDIKEVNQELKEQGKLLAGLESRSL